MYESVKFNLSQTSFSRKVQYPENGGAPVISGSVNKFPFSWTNSRSGTGMIGWKDRIRRGDDATTVFDGYRTSSEVKPGAGQSLITLINGRVYDYRVGGSLLAQYMSIPDATIVDLSNAVTQARREYFSKLREQDQKFSTGTFFGQIGETIHMLRHPAEALSKGLFAYTKAVTKNVKREISKRPLAKPGTRKRAQQQAMLNEVVGGTWLEYTFGWKPLVMDIEDAMSAYQSLLEDDHREVIRARGRSEVQYQPQETGWFYGPDNTTKFSYNKKTSHIAEIQYVAGIKHPLKGPTESQFDSARLAFGFDFADILPTVWELIPYSFLIDYFANVGDVIESWVTSQRNVRFIVGTTRQTSIVSLDGGIINDKGTWPTSTSYSTSGSPGSFTIKQTIVRRRVSAYMPSIPFQLSYPGAGSTRLLNIAALLVQSRAMRPLFSSKTRS